MFLMRVNNGVKHNLRIYTIQTSNLKCNKHEVEKAGVLESRNQKRMEGQLEKTKGGQSTRGAAMKKRRTQVSVCRRPDKGGHCPPDIVSS